MTDRPVILVTYDSLRADHCGAWGYERDTTPNLDAMAADGVHYHHAIATASRTNPAMAGALTGEAMVVRDRVADPTYARTHLGRHGTIAERFQEAGYRTAAFCPNAYASRYYGFDRGFDYFEDFMFDSSLYQRLFEDHLGDSTVSTLLRNARNFLRGQEAFKTWDSYIDDMVEWVEDGDRPSFLWAFSLDTHFPYLTPRRYRQWSSFFDQYRYNWLCNSLIDEMDVEITDHQRQKMIDTYDDSIRFGDALLGELTERLEDPIIVVHGDHGEAFAERGIYGHFYPSLYEENVHVPLVVSGVEETATVNDPVSLLDLPTILERAAGLSKNSLADLGHDWVYATDYDGRNDRQLTAVRTETLKSLHVSGADDRRECYDLASDPDERENRVDDHPAAEELNSLVTHRRGHEAELLGIRESIDDSAEGL